MDLEGFSICRITAHAFVYDIRFTSSSTKSRNKIFVSKDVVGNGSRLCDARPAYERGDAITPFPVGSFLTAKGSASAIGPRHHLRTIISCKYNDGVVGN